MAFVKQFKIILWKNWKYFLKTTNIYYFSFILFLSVAFIGGITSFQNEEFDYTSLPSVSPDNVFINNNFDNFLKNNNGDKLGFVFPKNQSKTSSEKLISYIMNDSLLVDTYQVKNGFKHMKSQIFEDEKELVDYINSDKTNSVLAAVIFNNEVYTNYTIRIRSNYVVDTKLPPINNYAQSRRSEYYDIGMWQVFRERYVYTGHTVADDYQSSFIPIQTMVDRAIIQLKTNETMKGYNIEVGKLSKPPIYYGMQEEFVDSLSYGGFGSYGILLFIVSFFFVGYRLLEEKENNTKECLISLGINRSILWMTWEAIYFQFDLILIIFMAILDPSMTLGGINRLIFIVFYILYMLSSHALIVIISFFTRKSKTLIMMVCFLLFSFIFINEYVYQLKFKGYEHIEKILSLIFSPINFSMGGCEITRAFCRHQYIGFGNLFESEFGLYLLFELIDVIVYYLIIFMMDYISGFDFRNIGIKKVKNSNKEDNPYGKDIQEDPVGLECLVQVRNITKNFKIRGGGLHHDSDDTNTNTNTNKKDSSFRRNTFLANDNISFNVYKNEIFAILGHNGAGKSTLIKNMIGYMKPDAGETYYNGIPISKNKKEIHRDIGICHQQNILFDKFTVIEHIQIYCGIKGIDVDIEKYLRDIDLWSKKDNEIQHLSGGQKRKLCIGLAFIGDPRYVFLDEPTTSLDPLSRQKIWSLLLKKKKDRVIFITTHYMDEADIIADRKLILKKGSIRCMGTSIYLKNHFHMKYRLEVETSHPKEVESIIKQYIPEAEYYNNKATVIEEKEKENNESHVIDIGNDNANDAYANKNQCYVWKLSNDSTAKFSFLLKDLEEKRGTLLHDFSLNSPLLQELFIKLEREKEDINSSSKTSTKDNNNNMKSINDENNKSSSSSGSSSKKLPSSKSVKRPNHLYGALRVSYYRFKIYFRQKIYILMTLVFPFIVMFFFFKIFSGIADAISLSNYQSLELSSEGLYKGQRWNYDVKNSTTLNQTLPLSIVEQEFPKVSIPGNNNNNNINDSNMMNSTSLSSSSSSSLTSYSTEEMETIGQQVKDFPYYVGSFQGNYSDIDHQYHFKILTNDSMPHALPSTLNALTNAIFASQGLNDTVHVISQPFNHFDIRTQVDLKYYSLIILSICITFVLAFYGSSVVYEKSSNLLKRLQLIGISNRSYWLSVFITDYIWFFVSWSIMILAIILSKFTPLLYVNFMVILVVYWAISSVSCLLFQYCISFIFKKESIAYLCLLIINLLPTFYITSDIKKNGYETDSENYTGELRLILFVANVCGDALLPNYAFTRVFKNLISLGIKHQAFHYDISLGSLFLIKNDIIPHFVGALLGIVIYTYLLYYLTKSKYYPSRKGVIPIEGDIKERFEEEDKKLNDIDLREEYQRIKKDTDSGKHSIPMKFVNLTHEYDGFDFSTKEEMVEAMNRKKASRYGELHISEFGSRRVVMTAFQNINFGINRCECFGVLGPNGSGKSTLLNTATFILKQTLGDIYYDGKNTLDRKGNEIPLGFCAQEDVVWNELTLIEHIEMHFFVRGHSFNTSRKLAKQLINYCHLQAHKNKYPYELSGGNLRKLNILMAICCSFTKIMLDEPTAGMDPSTRHYIWDIIRESIQCHQSSIVMTTHSMEEAEFLCHRLAIMVNGKLQCLGSPEHLKIKYGNTYLLDVQTKDTDHFHQKMVVERQLFGDAEYKREVKSPQHIKYEVINTKNISKVFEMMESCREEKLYIDYSYSQTSLEQVFLNFASLKENLDDQ